jgi:xanthine dehydrogenase accessory factor
MDDNLFITETICRLLEDGGPLILASIVSQQGSAPRHTGARMVISADGTLYGTIGGGLLEIKTVREAKSLLAERRSRLMYFNFDSNDVAGPDMICGGKATVMLEYLDAEGAGFFRTLRDSLKKGERCVYVTLFQNNDIDLKEACHCLVFQDGSFVEQHPLTPEDREQVKQKAMGARSFKTVSVADRQALIEPMGKAKTVYLFGAGHVAVPTSHVAALTGFNVTVVDDRAEFASAERFPDATVRVVEHFSHALDGLDIDTDSFLVIVTRSHLFDHVVLEAALHTKAGYIGMIASRRKRDALYRALLDKGFQQADLDRVHSPIGLEIGAETPEEIAVSIVAEMIKERAGQGK